MDSETKYKTFMVWLEIKKGICKFEYRKLRNDTKERLYNEFLCDFE